MTSKPVNFVLLIGEDTGRYLHCYGDHRAITPNIDRLAAEGVLYTNAFTHAPVCSPSRGGIVTGQYPTAIGFHHHRSRMAATPRLFTHDLVDAGYHVSWPGKQDFNFIVGPGNFTDREDWSEALPREPFFVYANLFQTHESNMRTPDEEFFRDTARVTPQQRHDPADVEVPPYLPDTPGVRREIARHHDNATAIDYRVGDVLQQLDRAGVADNTVVIFLADHGRGLPREKRFLYNHGVHMPLIIRGPGIAAGTMNDELVAWVDIAPTILSMAGAPVREDLHGQAFQGDRKARPRQYVYGARDRLDETVDRTRSVRSRRYAYIRNHWPHIAHMQSNAYMEHLATTKAMRAHYSGGKADPIQAAMFETPRPAEELYDTLNDPWEVHNLAGDRALAGVLEEHCDALDAWTTRFGDLGAIDEAELLRRGVLLHHPQK